MLNQNLPLYDYRHCMRPGLAGWAQLNFPYGASVEDANEKLKYDLFYIKNTGILFDLVILMQTLEVVIWGRGTSMAGPKAGAGDDGRPADSDRMDAAAGQGRGPAGRRQGDDGPAAERHAAQR